MSKINPYLKFVVALLGTVLTGLSVYYGKTEWFPIVTSVVTAVSVYIVPNTPAPVAAPKENS